MHLHTYTCSVTDLQNGGDFHMHENKGKIFVPITSMDKWNRQRISHPPFKSSIMTESLFFTAGIVLHQTICR